MVKAVRIAGLGSDAVRIVEVDGDLAMQPGALAARLERDVARGYTPVLVCATVGTTSTTAVDPLAEIGPICQKYGVWLHVDAAYAGRERDRPRAAPAAGRRGVGRQLHHRRAQVAAHRLRRDPVLGRRPRGPHRRAGDPPRVPPQRRHRRRDGRGLPRLADPARPPVPRPQAVVRAPLVRRRGPAGAHPLARRAGAGAGRLGAGRRPVRRRRAPSPVAGVPAAALGRRRGRRRRDDDPAGAPQRRRRGVPDPHDGRRPGGAAGGRGGSGDDADARRARLDPAAGGPRLAGRRLRGGRGRAGSRPGSRAGTRRGRAGSARRPSGHGPKQSGPSDGPGTSRPTPSSRRRVDGRRAERGPTATRPSPRPCPSPPSTDRERSRRRVHAAGGRR